MTQQNVRENIEAAIDLFFRKNNCGYSVYEMNVCLDQIRAYFLEWVKEAGYKSQEDCETCFGKFVRIEEQTIQKIYDAFGGEAMKDREGEIAKVIWQGVCDSEGEFQRGYADVMTKEILAFFPEWAKEAGLYDWYLSAYALLSMSVHVKVKDIEHYLVHDDAGRVSELKFGPENSQIQIVLATAIEAMLIALKGVAVLLRTDRSAQIGNLRTELVSICSRD